MTLHLLKNTSNPLALHVLASHSSAQTAAPVVILLALGNVIPPTSNCTVYRVTENSMQQDKETVSYARLVEMLFAADHVIAW